MPIVHAPPSQATVKQLYANAFRCAYPGCRRPLYKVDPDTGQRSLNSNVSHICARSEGGPRWDSSQSAEVNRSPSNLLLLCLEHAWEIDQPDRLTAFPAELLNTWKQRQLDDFDALGKQGWLLTSEMADEVLTASMSMHTTIRDSVLNLGGSGGKAPSAGGGGGGAFGPNSRGGSGGPGGATRYEGFSGPEELSANNEVSYAAKDVGDSFETTSLADYRLPSGAAPGAGGGGGGAIGENAVGGDGGGGGEHVMAHVSRDELAILRSQGFERLEFTIGEGGEGSRFPGAHGQDGSDTLVHFVAADGRVLRTIHATGGVAGRTGTAIPPGAREATSDDVGAGLALSTLLTADVVQIRDGVVNLLSAGWSFCPLPELPIDVRWFAFCVVSTGKVARPL